MRLYIVGVDRNASNLLNLVPLGIPTLIIADDPQLISAARAAYAYWLAEAPVSEPRIELRLETGRASPCTDVCLAIAVEGSRLRVSGGGVDGFADASTSKAALSVSPEMAGDATAFAEIVDTLLLFILARTGRTPIHASAFMLGDLAVVLAGPSGSGKSTLALAAALRGFPVLTDDMIFVQRDPSFAIWGFPRPIHVFPDDAPVGDHSTRLRNGKLKAAVPHTMPASRAERCALIVLERGNALEMRSIASEEAIKPLLNLDPGFDLLQSESRASLDALASPGAWLLTLSDDPQAAIDLVTRRLTGT
jgi:hypothetical protein